MPISDEERAANLRDNLVRAFGQDIESGDKGEYFDLLGHALSGAVREQRRREARETSGTDLAIKLGTSAALAILGAIGTWFASHMSWK